MRDRAQPPPRIVRAHHRQQPRHLRLERPLLAVDRGRALPRPAALVLCKVWPYSMLDTLGGSLFLITDNGTRALRHYRVSETQSGGPMAICGPFGLSVAQVGVLVAVIGASMPIGAQMKCADTPEWTATIGATTVCGCTQQEARNIASVQVKAECATAPAAAVCGGRTCPLATSTCKTVVREAQPIMDGDCMRVPQETLGCPADCPAKPVQCTIRAQTLRCDCDCKSNKCEDAQWFVTRSIDLGCVANNERAKRQALNAAFRPECEDAGDAQKCRMRVCSDSASKCVLRVKTTTRNPAEPTCHADERCPPEKPLSCTASGAVRCACECTAP
jgi:hypothetical protein